jgi:hypothetical protein
MGDCAFFPNRESVELSHHYEAEVSRIPVMMNLGSIIVYELGSAAADSLGKPATYSVKMGLAPFKGIVLRTAFAIIIGAVHHQDSSDPGAIPNGSLSLLAC